MHEETTELTSEQQQKLQTAIRLIQTAVNEITKVLPEQNVVGSEAQIIHSKSVDLANKHLKK